MKLKKIASLALAGVMAVSMLAGCAGKTGTTDNTDTEVSTSVSDIVKAINDGQSAGNKVKVTFTVDSKLDTALQAAVKELGAAADATKVKTAVTYMTGLSANSYTSVMETISNEVEGLIGSKNDEVPKYEQLNDKIKKSADIEDLDGQTFTYYNVIELKDFSSVEAVESYIADQVDAKVAALRAMSNVPDGTKVDTKYYSYTYDANASMTSYTAAAGVTTYYVALVVNQHITTKTV